MKKTSLAVLMLFVAGIATAAQPRSYAGTWMFDSGASKEMPAQYGDVKQWTLNVTQSPERLSVHVQIESKRPDRPGIDQTFEYALDGTETSTTTLIITPDGPKDVPTFLRALVSETGALDITITRNLVTGEEERRLSVKERWELAPDEKTLTVHRHDERPQGGTVDFDVVFKRTE